MFTAVEWELILEIYKTESVNELDGTVGIWLRQIGPNTFNDFVNTKYKIYAIKNFKRVDISRSTNKLENQQKMGFSTFNLGDVISSKHESSNGKMIYEGSVFIFCEVEIARHNPIADLQNKYQKMLKEETFTDCVFKVGDEVIKAHRCVLVQNNEVFKKMFGETGMIEAKNCEVTISDTTPECFRALLEYFYTGKINKDDKNFLKYCGIVSLYGAPTLEDACKDYCCTNRSFLNSKEWEDVTIAYTELAFKFMKFVIDDLDKK
uniref:BTB domain-containing protein n=1 Tax=Meloidogyne hapla TaxID=6305 RepID=A0A1I8B0T1_MELHA